MTEALTQAFTFKQERTVSAFEQVERLMYDVITSLKSDRATRRQGLAFIRRHKKLMNWNQDKSDLLRDMEIYTLEVQRMRRFSEMFATQLQTM